ncbi:MAG: CPBP family intramembrane glutamic endopeptidase [Ferruginibacter sp.]
MQIEHPIHTRTPLKDVGFTFLFWLIFIVVLFIGGVLIRAQVGPEIQDLVYGGIGMVASILATLIVLRIDRQSFASLGLQWQQGTIVRFIKGLLIGALLFGGIVFLLLLFTHLRIKPNSFSLQQFPWLLYLAIIPLALMEEVAFRGYPLIKLNRTCGIYCAQIIIALVFALYHIVQGWDVTVAFLGPGIWAIIFGWAALYSKGIAMPTGIHVALNAGQNLVGMKGASAAAFWLIEQPVGATESSITRANTIGLLTQVLMLLIGIVLTVLFVNKIKKR